MGQRSQIIIKLPKYYINQDNPNNRPAEWLVYHNQWLYGIGFAKHLRDIIKIYKTIKRDYEKSELSIYTPDYKDMIEKAIKCANYKDPKNIRNSHRYDESADNNTSFIISNPNWNRLFERLDNNNGFIILEIDEQGIIGYDIVNGLEDAETFERRTTGEYMNLFYKQEEILADKECQRILNYMAKIKRINYNDLSIGGAL